MIEMTLAEPQRWQPFPWSTTKVRISDDARKCVVYLGCCDPSGDPATFDPFATEFLIRQPEVKGLLYLVTAKHCVKDGHPFFVRMNTASGAETVLIESPDWAFHEDSNVDVAIMEFVPPAKAEYTAWKNGGLSDRRLAVGDFGPGDLTYTVGLFSFHSGRTRNVPLVHTGHIAAFSEDEKIEVPDWDVPAKDRKYRYIDAYIIQCAAMPGASGSPVFVRKPIGAADEMHKHDLLGNTVQWKRVPPKAYGAIFLLGLWHGSWEVDPAERGDRLPSGYGIVIPGQKILEVIDMPKLKAKRDLAKGATGNKNLPVADSLPAKTAKKRFDQTLKTMLNSPPDPKRVTGKSDASH